MSRLVFTAQGIPFIQEGEEFMRTKAYEKDGEIHYSGNSYNVGDSVNNMDYSLKIANEDVNNYFVDLIKFRNDNAAFRLSSREEINSKLTNLKCEDGVISFDVTDGSNAFRVYHTTNAKTIDLDNTYNVAFTNTELTIGGAYNQLVLTNNGSVVLRIH